MHWIRFNLHYIHIGFFSLPFPLTEMLKVERTSQGDCPSSIKYLPANVAMPPTKGTFIILPGIGPRCSAGSIWTCVSNFVGTSLSRPGKVDQGQEEG